MQLGPTRSLGTAARAGRNDWYGHERSELIGTETR